MNEKVVTPKISVIIPCYNVEKYLRECLDSVVNQTLKDIEIICVNDGSTDGTQKILEEYEQKDNRILVINKPNGGLSSARNAGMGKVHGEYLAFLDSDDWVDLNFYEKLYNAAKLENADSAIGKTFLYWDKNKIEKISWIDVYVHNLNKNIIDTIADKRFVIYTSVVWNKIYRTELIKNNGLRFIEGGYIEDLPFTFALAMQVNKFVLVPDTALYYRQRDNSIMANLTSGVQFFDVVKAFDNCEKYLQNIDINSKTKKSYKNILDNFRIKDLYIHYFTSPKKYKQELWDEMLKRVDLCNLLFNPYIDKDSVRAGVKILEHIIGNFVRKILYIEIEQKKY